MESSLHKNNIYGIGKIWQNVDTKATIEANVQAHFNSNTKPGTLQFTYDKTANGYKYCFERYLPYGYNADVIIDVDCS